MNTDLDSRTQTVIDNLNDVSSYFTKSILDSSADCIKVIERDGSVSYMNPNGQCAMEIDDFQMIAGKIWSDLWPADGKILVDDAVRRAVDGKTSHFDAYCPTARGNPKWWHVSVSPIKDNNGKIVRILSISQDITEVVERDRALKSFDVQVKKLNKRLVEELEQKNKLLNETKLLAREIDHRVKNSLTMITSLLRLQSRSARNPSERTSLEMASNRVASVSRVHERLHLSRNVSSVDMQTYLTDLLNDIQDGISDGSIIIFSDIDNLELAPDSAIALGMVVNEIVSNAFLHAFPESQGQIDVELKFVGENSGRLIVSDNGTGLPDSFEELKTAGIGRKIISAYARTLGADLVCDSELNIGTKFTLTFVLR